MPDENCYKKFVKGLTLIGESLAEMNTNEEHQPIELLISRLVARMGFNNQELVEELTMVRFAVENDDYSLVKLTAQIMGAKSEEPVNEPSAV